MSDFMHLQLYVQIPMSDSMHLQLYMQISIVQHFNLNKVFYEGIPVILILKELLLQ
jgi:hypothetical protein